MIAEASLEKKWLGGGSLLSLRLRRFRQTLPSLPHDSLPSGSLPATFIASVHTLYKVQVWMTEIEVLLSLEL